MLSRFLRALLQNRTQARLRYFSIVVVVVAVVVVVVVVYAIVVVVYVDNKLLFL